MRFVKNSRIYILDLAEVRDHFRNDLKNAVPNIFVLGKKAFEKMFEKTRDEARCRGIFVIVLVTLFFRSYKNKLWRQSLHTHN